MQSPSKQKCPGPSWATRKGRAACSSTLEGWKAYQGAQSTTYTHTHHPVQLSYFIWPYMPPFQVPKSLRETHQMGLQKLESSARQHNTLSRSYQDPPIQPDCRGLLCLGHRCRTSWHRHLRCDATGDAVDPAAHSRHHSSWQGTNVVQHVHHWHGIRESSWFKFFLQKKLKTESMLPPFFLSTRKQQKIRSRLSLSTCITVWLSIPY